MKLFAKNMKIKTILVAVAACVLAAACGKKVSDVTTITGTVEGDDLPSSVTVSVPGVGDTAADVVNGKFTIKVPASSSVVSFISTDNGIKGRFISDGTPLTMTLSKTAAAVITSKYPKVSVQARNDALHKTLSELTSKYQTLSEEFKAKGEDKMDSLYTAFEAEYIDVNKKAFEQNTDNIIAATALDNLQYDLKADDLSSMISSLSSEMLESERVQSIKKTIESKVATAEGKMFTDFEVNGVKFSTFVGNGKYVLVDFWASWCGPCKAEIPNIRKVYEKYAGSDFDVLSVAVWDKPEATVAAAKEEGITWPQMIDAQRIPTDIYGIQGIPHIILFGPDGTILKRDLRGDDIESEVAKYVQAKK
jgi:Thiol-disulfide isomerase and thioredoxins